MKTDSNQWESMLLDYSSTDDQKLLFKTPRDLIRYATTQFNIHQISCGHGTTNTYDEAIYLVLYSLHLPLERLEPFLDAKLLTTEIVQILNLINQRIESRIPLAYIFKEAFIQGYAFYIDQRAIIPRSYIAEIIINQRLNRWIEHQELIHEILDLCTGNGSLAIIAADYFTDAQVWASDISLDALAVAAINVKRYNLNQRINLLQSDLFTQFEASKQKFDLIITNPPYVSKKIMETLTQEYSHEPQNALTGGDNGLELIIKIIDQAKNYLNDFGLLVVEMGENFLELEELYPNLNFNYIESGDGVVFVLSKEDLI